MYVTGFNDSALCQYLRCQAKGAIQPLIIYPLAVPFWIVPLVCTHYYIFLKKTGGIHLIWKQMLLFLLIGIFSFMQGCAGLQSEQDDRRDEQVCLI